MQLCSSWNREGSDDSTVERGDLQACQVLWNRFEMVSNTDVLPEQ